MDESKLTTEEMIAEWRYRYDERLGIMCEGREPTDEQKNIAGQEADEAIRQLGY